MPQFRTSKSLAQRVDTSYQRRPNRLRRWRVWISIVALAIPLVWLAVAESRGDRRVYQAGPVSTAHQMLAQDCQACHQDAWQPLARLVKWDNTTSSTSDAACQSCHDGPVHHQNAATEQFRCADCHREHRGHDALARVDDRFCGACHGDLQTNEGASDNFARRLGRFAEHPEFAVLRPIEGEPLAGPAHGVHQVAQAVDGRWRDKAQIALNHRLHLNPGGIPRSPGDKQLVVMKCEDCHQLDAERRYMRPIQFDQHCASCHCEQLTFSLGELADDEATKAAAAAIVTRLPHRNPEMVRGVMRERLTTFIKQRLEEQPDYLSGDTRRDKNGDAGDLNDAAEPIEDSAARRFFPGQAPPEKLTPEAWDWVAERMHAAEGLLFRQKLDAAERGLGCAYCHVVGKENGAVSIAPPEIPNRWLSHSQFRHDSHRLLSCNECHGAAISSTLTADVLLPGIESCRKCHGAGKNTAGAARSDCVECHLYHPHQGGHFAGALSIEAVRQGQTTATAKEAK